MPPRHAHLPLAAPALPALSPRDGAEHLNALIDCLLDRLLGIADPPASDDPPDRVPGAVSGPSGIGSVTPGAVGRAAAHGGLSPDALLALLEDGVAARGAGASERAADAVVLAVWGGARDTYHATRASLDAAHRRHAAPDATRP
jgi:hypothetical protein